MKPAITTRIIIQRGYFMKTAILVVCSYAAGAASVIYLVRSMFRRMTNDLKGMTSDLKASL